MTLDIEKASKMERPPIKIGNRYPFYSTLEGKDGLGVQCRKYTGQSVTVTADTTEEIDYEEIQERIFTVRADDGTVFSAWEGELNDWFFDTGQYYTPNGEWQR